MVSVQMLSELEEIIQFKLVPERREAIKRTWWNRLQVRRNVKFVGLDINKFFPTTTITGTLLRWIKDKRKGRGVGTLRHASIS